MDEVKEDVTVREVAGPTMEVMTKEEYMVEKDKEDFARVEKVFIYHKPIGNQADRYERIRSWGKDLANLIINSCPHSRERSLALTQLQQTIMWANAAIAINESEGDCTRGV